MVSVLVEIRIRDHARHILAVQVVVGGVDVPDKKSSHGWRRKKPWPVLPDTPVGVVVTVGAGAKRSTGPKWRSFPMIVIVTEILMRKYTTTIV